MSRGSWIKALTLAVALLGLGGLNSAQAQDWTDYLHWPYVPPQVPGNGFDYNGLYDGWYKYPREQRIVPQIQGPYYRNFYGGYRVFGIFRHPNGWHDWKFWQFTNKASVAGIPGSVHVDEDRFHGSLTELRAYSAAVVAARPRDVAVGCDGSVRA